MSGRREMPDSRPVEWPVGISRPKTIQEMIQESIRTHFSQQASRQGMESFEEADDFDVEDDDGDFVSPYEIRDMPVDVMMQERATGTRERESEDGNKGAEGARRAERAGSYVDRERSQDEGREPPEKRRQGGSGRGEGVRDKAGSGSGRFGPEDRDPEAAESFRTVRSDERRREPQ